MSSVYKASPLGARHYRSVYFQRPTFRFGDGLTMLGLWIGTTKNRKTGSVPTLAVGATREESLASCRDCGLLKSNAPDGKGRFYAQHSSPSWAHAQMVKTNKEDPTRYTFEYAMGKRFHAARMARFGSIGDPSAINHATLHRWIMMVRAEGMSVVGYTHHWRDPENQWLRDHFMASCETFEQAEEAIAMGWRPTVVVPTDWDERHTMSDGSPVLTCPAITSKRKGTPRVTCNDCRLCDVNRNRAVIAFPDHGPARKRK